jgi:ABC-type Co2+ transport system permease subunit
MGDEATGTRGQGDWFRGARGWLVWGLPIAILVISPILYGVGVLPLGANGWYTLCDAVVIGAIVLCCVPEWILGRYRSKNR